MRVKVLSRRRRISQSLPERPARGGRPACAPTLDGGTLEAQLLSGFAHTRAGRAEQNDSHPRHEALHRALLAHDGLETAVRFVGQVDGAATQRAMANASTQAMMCMTMVLPCTLHKRYQDFHSAALGL